MDLATGTFTNATPTEEAGDEDASSVGDDAADGDDEPLEDEVPGEFEAPGILNNDINLLMSQRTTQVEDTSSVVASVPTVAARLPTDTSSVAASVPTVAARLPTVATTPSPTSRGSTSARPLVSPWDLRGSNRNNLQRDGLLQMMQMSMLQHNQYIEEERKRRNKERKDRLAMQQMLVTTVAGAFAALEKYTNSQEE
jgi:hypothetical protein